jgi:glycerol transport system ATP-binding protein
VGSPADLFERPSHTFVGNFIGSPGMNFIHAQVTNGVVRVGSQALALPTALTLPAGDIKLGIRPEYVTVAPTQTAGSLPMRVIQVQDVGTHFIVTAEHEGQRVKARLSADDAAVQVGQVAWLQVLGGHTCFYKNEEIVA